MIGVTCVGDLRHRQIVQGLAECGQLLGLSARAEG